MAWTTTDDTQVIENAVASLVSTQIKSFPLLLRDCIELPVDTYSTGTIARITAFPQIVDLTEGSAVPETDATYDEVSITASKFGARVIASNEWIEDHIADTDGPANRGGNKATRLSSTTQMLAMGLVEESNTKAIAALQAGLTPVVDTATDFDGITLEGLLEHLGGSLATAPAIYCSPKLRNLLLADLAAQGGDRFPVPVIATSGFDLTAGANVVAAVIGELPRMLAGSFKYSTRVLSEQPTYANLDQSVVQSIVRQTLAVPDASEQFGKVVEFAGA